GAPLPTRTLRGRVIDWMTQRPQPRALIEAVLLPDSLPSRTRAHPTRRFTLGPIPPRDYLGYGLLGPNTAFPFSGRTACGSLRMAATRDSGGEIWAFRHDSTAARLTAIALNDSLSLLLTFSQNLNPYQRLPAESVEVRLLPDSVRVPVLRLLPKEEYD